MNAKLLIYGTLLLFFGCGNPKDHKQSNSGVLKDSIPKALGHGYDYENNGKLNFQSLDSAYTRVDLDTIPFPTVSKELLKGLEFQLKLAKRKKNVEFDLGEKKISTKDLVETIETLISSHDIQDFEIENFLQAYQLPGEDNKGNVHYTGYFTPILEVREKQDSIFKFPLYRFPEKWNGPMPSRKEIDADGALEGKGLEIAYAKSKLDIYFMQVQGSGIVEYEDGETILFAYAGANKHAYKSIGRYMIEKGFTTKAKVSLQSIKKYFEDNPDQLDDILYINPSYIFFSPQNSKPLGAGNVPLTPYHSIAVDKDMIPLGSCLLGSVPILDKNRNFSHHEYRILIAQDVGGAINGGHVDLYTGIGTPAKNAASNLHHYGRLWLLLTKNAL